jgi:uncharacterized protein YcbK (DUF882 family)
LSSHSWIPSRRVLGLAWLAAAAACGGERGGPATSVPWDDPWLTPLHGEWQHASAVRSPGSSVAPESLVASAIEDALAAVAIEELEGEGRGLALGELAENRGTTAHTEAWLRVDEAQVFAQIEVSPTPHPDPVSVETQRLAAAGRVPPGELHLHVPGLGERRQIRLFDNAGRMRPVAVREVSMLMRDRRDERTRTIEPRVLTMLYLVGQYYDSEIEVISGYRIGGENASSGSRHGSGHACDFRVEGVGTRTLSRYVDGQFERVGVGYYPTSRFVHLDHRTRSYYWIDRSGPGQRSRTRSRTPSETPDDGTDRTLGSIHVTERELFVPPPPDEE